MITPDEAAKTMNAMIESIPVTVIERENFGFLVSKEVASALDFYVRMLSGMPLIKQFESGEEFTWRGFKCKVA